MRQASLRGSVSLALLLFGVSCTADEPEPRATTAVAQSPRSPTPDDAGVSACPISHRAAREDLPIQVVRAVLGHYHGPPVENIGYWVGNDALWVELPQGAEVVKGPGERLNEKFPWVRLVRGQIEIEGRRLDAPAPAARGDASTGNGPIGFNSSGIRFPTTGCWEITGTISGHQLTFVVGVRRTG
jgi:hypothetical protein